MEYGNIRVFKNIYRIVKDQTTSNDVENDVE